MKYVPKGLSRFAGRQLLKINKNSPTILVVGGVVGLGATAVVAARATRNLDPVLDEHKKSRQWITQESAQISDRERQKMLLKLYMDTGSKVAKIYAPAFALGSVSAVCVLSGHKILKPRHIATMAAYSGLMDQLQSYRERVAKTVGADMEREIYNGAKGEWVEDPNHKGEYKLEAKHDKDAGLGHLRPWFDASNYNWTKNPDSNYQFLRGVQSHLNHILESRGHVFLNEVTDALKMERTPEGAVQGWVYEDTGNGDGYIDLGFMTGTDPNTMAFRNHAVTDVQLNFNVDEKLIWDRI